MPLDSAANGKRVRWHIATAILVTIVFAMPVLAQRSSAQNQLSSPAEDGERIRRLTANGGETSAAPLLLGFPATP